MKKDAATFEEAEAIINPLIAEDKWAINVIQKNDGTFTIQWLEHKKYKAHDGQEFHDEIWTTREGEMKLIQDLEPEHVRNILRMMLRNEREASNAMKGFFKQIAEEIQEFAGDDMPEPEKKILH